MLRAARSSQEFACCRRAISSACLKCTSAFVASRVTPLGRGSIACGIQQIASPPMQCGSTEPLVGRLDYLRSLGEAIQSFQILACQIAQNARIDVVFGKALRVLGHAE
jgi:hypothetical protein